MPISRFAGLRPRLMLFAFLVALPFIGLSLFTFAERRQHAINDVQQEALQLTGSLRLLQEHLSEEAHELLREMAGRLENDNAGQCDASFGELLEGHPEYVNLAAATPDGNVFCSALSLSDTVNFATMPFFQRAIESRGFSVGDYQISHATGKPVLTYAYPLYDDQNTLEAVIFASLDLTWLNETLAHIPLPPDAGFTVIDQNGAILARYPDSQPWVGQRAAQAPLIEAALRQQGQGATEVEDLDGRRRLYAFNRLQSAPSSGAVYVSVGIPVELAFAEANTLLVRDLLAFAVINLVALSLAWFSSDFFVRRYILALLRAAQRLAAGDLSARTGLDYRLGEPGQLAQAFDEMAAALQQREVERKQVAEALRESQLFLEKAQEVAQLGNWISGPGREMSDQVIWSREVFDILGLDEAAFDGKLSTFFSLVHPDDLAAVQKADKEAVANNTPYDIEHRIVRPDGSIRWIHSRGEVVRDERGEPLRWIGVVQDITERKQAEEALRRYAAELEQRVAERTAELQTALRQEKQLNELKARFASMVTHEFRNPLASIHLSSDVLKRYHHKLTDDKRLEHIERIQTRVRYLVELLDDILTISRADTVGLEFHAEPLNLASLCRKIIEDMQPDNASTRRIVFSDDSGCMEINGDEKLLRQMMTNLLSNALKYSLDGGEVRVALRCEADQVVLRVTDQGIGIPEADMKHLFEVFHRAKNAAGIPGTGLGLAIAKRAVEAHGGTITVESRVGVGSTFTVRLPLVNSQTAFT